MTDKPSVEEVAEAMYGLVAEYKGRKRFSAQDLQKEMIARFGADRCDRQLCKAAVRTLIDSGRCIYGYAGGSFVTLPEDA